MGIIEQVDNLEQFLEENPQYSFLPQMPVINPLIPGILPEGLNIKSLSPREYFRNVRSFPGQALNELGLPGV